MRVRNIALTGFAVLSFGGGAAFFLRPTAVPAEHPAPGPIRQTIVVSGQVLPPAEIRLAAFVSSTCKEVLVQEGDQVEPGQLLLRLDDEDARAGVDQAKATLAAARAGRTELSRLGAPQAEAALRQADASLAEARSRLTREQNLHKAGATTDVTLEEAKTAAQLAEAQRQAAFLQLRAASAGGSQSLGAQANIALAQAQLARAEVQLTRHEVRAPTAGVVVTRSVEPGDAVLSGAGLFVLSATGATRLRVEPDERNLALLKLGQAAIASAEAFPRDHFPAQVSYIAPAIDPARGTVEVHLLVKEPPEFLRQNMTVSVEITVAEKPDALLIPRAAVRAEKTDPSVLTLRGDSAQRTAVDLGLIGDEKIEVKGGLSPQDLVITAPQGTVQPGQKVRAAASDAAVAGN